MRRKRSKKRRTYEKIIKIPNGVIDQIQQDLRNDCVRIYEINQVPNIFIQKNLINPNMLKKSTCVAVATSACFFEKRNYMYLAAARIDEEKGQKVTDLDPIVMVSDLETGSPAPTGVITFHSDYEGRTEILETKSLDVPFDELKKEVKGNEISFEEAPERLKNVMHFSAEVYRKNLGKNEKKNNFIWRFIWQLLSTLSRWLNLKSS